MSDSPKRAADTPEAVELETGKTYSWCTCGLSKTMTFCDGTHKEGTDFKSLKFEVDESGTKWLCRCKQTKNPPYCDGSHSSS